MKPPLAYLDENERRAAIARAIIGKPNGSRHAGQDPKRAGKRRSAAPDDEEQLRAAPWLAHCKTDDRGRIIPNLANALVALRDAPEIADAVAFDEMLVAPVLTEELPGSRIGSSGQPFPRPLTDADEGRLQEWLQRAGMPTIARETVRQAIDQRAKERTFHPVRSYLSGLKWDGRPRLETWLSDYLGAEPGPYAEGLGSMFLTSMAARVFQPGCKADHMLVLEGAQGIGKSTAASVLAGEWFSDSLPDIRHKDALQHLRGKWIIEVAELSAISRADAAYLKSFISRSAERFRPTWGRNDVFEPRQCVFVGTTNDSFYLRDDSGARRFWPIKVGPIDLDELRRNRDQLFAEAVVRFRGNGRWWPDAAFQDEHIKPQQDARSEGDPWDLPVCEYLEARPPGAKVTVKEIASAALGLEIAKVGTTEERRIGRIVRRRGWKDGRGAKGRFYSAPEAEAHDS